MEVIIRLPAYDYERTINREDLMTAFPNSLLAQSAELTTPEDNVIPITSPLVTPKVLSSLLDYIHYKEISLNIPDDADLVAASNYLNIPQLILMSDPWFPMFRLLYPEINTWEIDGSVDRYGFLLNMAIFSHATRIAWYLMTTVKPEPEEERSRAESIALLNAALTGETEVVRLLLKRVNPATSPPDVGLPFEGDVQLSGLERVIYASNVMPNKDLRLAILRNHNGVIEVLLADPRTHLENLDYYDYAYGRNAYLALQRLLLHPDTTAEVLSKLLTEGIIPATSDAARMIYLHPAYDPNLDAYTAFREILQEEDQNIRDTMYEEGEIKLNIYYNESAEYIFLNPHTDPIQALNSVFVVKCYFVPTNLAWLWITSPGLNVEALSNYFLMSMLWLWHLDILREFVRLYPQMKERLRALSAQKPCAYHLNFLEEDILPILA